MEKIDAKNKKRKGVKRFEKKGRRSWMREKSGKERKQKSIQYKWRLREREEG